MKKKIVASFLTMAMVLSLAPAAFAADTTAAAATGSAIKVYVSVSKYDDFVKDKDNKDMFYREVELSGKDTYTIDDALRQASITYDANGEADYASSDSSYGTYLTKIWGDDSGLFIYEVNNGDTAVMSLDTNVSANDYIHAHINQSVYPDNEDYAFFDKENVSVDYGKPVELTLKTLGYDESWNQVSNPCADAEIYVDGQDAGVKTDADGKVSVSFSDAGTHFVTAKKTKTVSGAEVTAITAAGVSVTVNAPAAGTAIRNTSAKYEVTKAGSEVAYVSPVKKAATVSVPSTVTIGGVKYKVTSIAKNAFKNDSKVKTLTIGKNVKKIGSKAFYNAKNLKKITIKSKSLKKSNIGSKAFTKAGSNDYKKLTVNVPSSKKSAYKKAFRSKGLSSKAKIK